MFAATFSLIAYVEQQLYSRIPRRTNKRYRSFHGQHQKQRKQLDREYKKRIRQTAKNERSDSAGEQLKK